MDFLDYLTVLLVGVMVCILVFAICFLCNVTIDTMLSGNNADDPCIPVYLNNSQTESIQATHNSNPPFYGIELLEILPSHRSMLGIDKIMSGCIADIPSIPVYPDDPEHETIQRTHNSNMSLNGIQVLQIIPQHRRWSE